MNSDKKYRHGIVSFIDLLGFGANVDSGKPANEIFEMLESVQRAGHIDKETKKIIQIESLCVSDCMIRSQFLEHSTRVLAPDIQFELLSLIHIQCALIQVGYPVRGGVTHGKVYFEDRTLFGPAYQRAFTLESKEANFPRILIDACVVDDFYGFPEGGGDVNHGGAYDELHGLIRKDGDGKWFLDYLRVYQSEVDDTRQYFQFLLIHKDLISNRLIEYIDKPNVSEKYSWMANYHNGVVNEIKEAAFEECGVTKANALIPRIVPAIATA